MKLKKSIYKTTTTFYNKFENILPKNLHKGDFIRLIFLSYNQKRRGGDNFRISQQTAILQKKKTSKKLFKFFSNVSL